VTDRAARNDNCCEHAASDHDLWGCAVNVSTSSRAYERCHGLVEKPDLDQLAAEQVESGCEPRAWKDVPEPFREAMRRQVSRSLAYDKGCAECTAEGIGNCVNGCRIAK
jgi:hypothetical protein